MKIEKFGETYKSSCEIINDTNHNLEVIEPVMLDLDLAIGEDVQIQYYYSDWGDEFSPRWIDLNEENEEFSFEAIKGRSAKHANPNFYVKTNNKVSLFHIAWSGNFKVSFKKTDKLNIKVALEPGFRSVLNPGGEFAGFDVVYTLEQPSLNHASQNLHEYVRKQLYKGKDYVPPLVWNHWWTYEDIAITEDIFKANVDVAADMGFEYAMLDAGWFGETSQFWELIRGDWHAYNKRRFPSGIKSLSEYVNSKGLKFGIWIELEGLGPNSVINTEKPWLVAKDGDKSLEYICLGAKDNQDWAFDQFKMLIEDFGAEYIKVDFNLDPQQGCNCEAHDHGSHDGLYEHYKGLYSVFKKVKEHYPHVVLENCSSGGLRADMALLENMDICFMSDPDYTEHSHQCYQGFRTFLPSERIFHFSWSHAIDKGRYAIPQCDYNNKNLTSDFKRYTLRSVSQHAFGLSHPLIDYSKADLELIVEEMKLHRRLISIINTAKLYCPPVTTIKNFQGERNPYYVFETDDQILMFNYGLEMAEYSQVIDFKELGLDFEKLEVIEAVDADYILEENRVTVKNKPQTASILILSKR